MPPDRTQVVEDPYPESDDGGDVQLDSQLVAEVGQTRRQGRVGQEPAEEDARLEGARDVGLERAEDGVESGEQRDRVSGDIKPSTTPRSANRIATTITCKSAPVTAKAEAYQAMAKGLRVCATYSPRPARPGS